MWKPIPGFTDFEASDAGQIRRVRYSLGYARNSLPFIVRCGPNKAGYLCCSLRGDDGTSQSRLVHQLVAAAFHGPRPDTCTMVCHRDGDKANNVPANLYYGDHKNNGEDCIRHGTYVGRYRNNDHPTQKLNADAVRLIKSRLSLGEGPASIARDFGVRPTTISMIANGKNWGWVQ